MSNRSDFKRIRRVRLCWVWGLTIATLLLFVCLLFTWMDVKWWIFPLQGFMVDIFENLFFSFTTGTIMMWFQSSVDGYAQMREEYKEIELNTRALSNVRLDILKDYVEQSLKIETKEISIDDDFEIHDDAYVISNFVKAEDYLSYREYPKKELDEVYLNYEKGYFENVVDVTSVFHKWKKEIDIYIIRNEFNRYIDILEKWIEQLEQNEYYYSPDRPDILDAIQDFSKVFVYRLKHERVSVWCNEEDNDSCIYKLDVGREFKKTREYINNRYKTIDVEEMKQLLNELRSMGEGYVENGRWILDIDTIEDREAAETKQVTSPNEIIAPVYMEYNREKTMFLYRTKKYERRDEEDEYGNERIFAEVGAKEKYGTALLNVHDSSFAEEYLREPPDYHTMNPDYLADIYLRMKKFECLVDNYNREYQADKRAMRKTFERKYRKKK